MLSLLVYVAAEIGAQQFIEIIFTSSAKRVVYNAYKDNLPLPETIARDHGYIETANYLADVTNRYKCNQIILLYLPTQNVFRLEEIVSCVMGQNSAFPQKSGYFLGYLKVSEIFRKYQISTWKIYSISLKALKQQCSNMADTVTLTGLNVPRRLLILEETVENFGLNDTKSAYFSSKNKKKIFRARFFRKIQIGFLNPKESENGFCISLLNRSIQDLSDHGESN